MSRHLMRMVAGLAGGWVALIPPAAMAEEGFVSLFNGRDLDGWVIQDGPDGCFRARDGRLECTGAYGFPAWLRSERTYENFTLRFEFRLGYYAESGLLIHAPLHGRKSRVGIGVKLCDDEAPGARAQHCGTIIGVSPPRYVATHHFDEWNQVEVHVPQVLVLGGRGHLSVQGVPGLEHHLFAGFYHHSRRYVRMPPVVALGGLISASFGVVQLYAFQLALL